MGDDSKGDCKVGDEIRKHFHTKKGKLRLMQVFQRCRFDMDRGLTKRVIAYGCFDGYLFNRICQAKSL